MQQAIKPICSSVDTAACGCAKRRVPTNPLQLTRVHGHHPCSTALGVKGAGLGACANCLNPKTHLHCFPQPHVVSQDAIQPLLT